MYHIQCPGCLTSAYIDCGCPDGHDAVQSGHHDACAMGSVGAQVVCPPGHICCQEDHDHDATANACTGHEGDCGKDNAACPVCRPLIITALPGSARMHPVGG